MALIISDLVKETTTTTGTGAKTLAGARAPAARTVSSVLANGDTGEFAISHDTSNEWEIGLYTYSSGANTLTRVGAPYASSNGGAAVNFSAGTKKVDLVLPAQRIRLYPGPVQIGATSFGSGSLSFSDLNGVSWGLATDTNGGTVTASVAAGADSLVGLVSHVGGALVTNVSRVAFENSNNVTFSLSTNANAATMRASVANAGFSAWAAAAVAASNSFTTLTASSIVAGTVGGPEVRFPEQHTSLDSLFSYANVLWRFQTGAVVQSARQAAFQRYFGSGTAVVGGVSAQQVSFSVSNNVTFGLTSSTFAGFGVVPIYTASASDVRLGVVSHVGGNVVSPVAVFAFEDASNVSWSLSTAANAVTVRASVAAGGGGGITAVNLSAGTTSQNLTNFVFSNSNNVSFGLNGSTVTASASVASSLTAINVSAGTTSNNLSAVVFSNSNGVSFGLNGSTVTASAQQEIGLVSHIGGNQVSSVTRLAFSNASDVTWSLSTAANAATVLASVAAAGGVTYQGYIPHKLAEISINQIGQSSLHLSPLLQAPAFQHDRIVMPFFFSWNSTSNSAGTLSLSINVGIYTRNASTLSLVSSTSTTQSFQYSSATGTSVFFGVRNISIPWTATWPASDYWLGMVTRTASAGFNGISASQGMIRQISSTLSGEFGVAATATKQLVLGLGLGTSNATIVPASIGFTAITGTSPAALRAPFYHFGSGTA